ncbi:MULTISPECIES: hypothetical protein [unclassified Bradyrhizobium]|uniref:hypothetical protein n=1 Tax=unclassified Bradyrhizobium TaxID=2631580 RepID=UPI0028ED85F5|nr:MULTISPECIES: hypothetical protein [unclassified Bradyrhizobium]
MDNEKIERQIAEKMVDDALAAGYTIDVWDGGDFPLKQSSDREAILKAMFSTDEDRLYLTKDGKTAWVWLVYGNSYHLISDYTISLATVLAGAEKLSDELEDQYGQAA